MARTNKNTRIKGLPAKIQLQEKDSLQGSYPPKKRISSDNRNGLDNIFWDDGNVVIFQNYSNLELGLGINSGSGFITNTTEQTTNITASGILRKGVGDNFIQFSSSQNFQPFVDHDNPACDGKSSNNIFYTTGSQVSVVGEGFNQPLWSKTKIEIDITPTRESSFGITNFLSSSTNFPMAYWNKNERIWEGIGNGREFGYYIISGVHMATTGGADIFFEEQCIGFNESFDPQGDVTFTNRPQITSKGTKVSNWHFPYHIKFHGTSSNLIKMSDYISTPFLLEKIVLICSATYSASNEYSTPTLPNAAVAMNTFFILNQRKPFKIIPEQSRQTFKAVINSADVASSIQIDTQIPSSSNEVRNGDSIATTRDLITWMTVSQFDPNLLAAESYSKELNVSHSFGVDDFYWSQNIVVSGVVKNPLKAAGNGFATIDLDADEFATLGSYRYRFVATNKTSGRTGLENPGGRDFLNAISDTKIIGTVSPAIIGSLFSQKSYEKTNPYFIFPEDNLIFGWQLPLANALNFTNDDFGYLPIYNGQGDKIFFAPTESKIIFYGSTVTDGVENHETLNQILTSNAIHEVIG